MTDLLAPRASTKVISIVMPKATKSSGRPNIVPTVAAILRPMAPPVSESKLELRAHAQALVPGIKGRKQMFM